MDYKNMVYIKGDYCMSEKLVRVGTFYLPVMDLDRSSTWFVDRLGADLAIEMSTKRFLI